jgi:hypothetical protein
MFEQLTAWMSEAPGRVALFRETGSDHSNVPPDAPENAYTADDVGHVSEAMITPCRCREREEAELIAPKLNNYVRKLLPRFPLIGSLPFYELTAPRVDSHEAGYCSFDQMREAKADPSKEAKYPFYCWREILPSAGGARLTLRAATARTTATRRSCGGISSAG